MGVTNGRNTKPKNTKPPIRQRPKNMTIAMIRLSPTMKRPTRAQRRLLELQMPPQPKKSLAMMSYRLLRPQMRRLPLFHRQSLSRL